MQDNFEGKFYNELAKIEDIKNKVDKLQSDYKKLSKRIDRIEIQGTQEQLNSLHDSILETKQWVACLQIYVQNMYLNIWIAAELSALTNPTLSQATEFIKSKGEKAHDKARKSSNPASAANQFMTDCEEYFQIHGLEPYRDQKTP